jgi:hypothetical protein
MEGLEMSGSHRSLLSCTLSILQMSTGTVSVATFLWMMEKSRNAAFRCCRLSYHTVLIRASYAVNYSVSSGHFSDLEGPSNADITEKLEVNSLMSLIKLETI